MTYLDISRVEQDVKGMVFPVSRAEVIKSALNSAAGSEVIKLLKQMPDREYRDLHDLRAELMKSLTEVRANSHEIETTIKRRVAFLASGKAIKEHVKKTAPKTAIIDVVNELPEKEYTSVPEVMDEIEPINTVNLHHNKHKRRYKLAK